ncbi:hypothetical protein MIND_00090900 [Mycena indigotica]|uniref:DUF6534 domain-containing protein n=1 Tax=Mycena indigotica TaxID=2126181 RepID=A0A8H6TE18_9AGAR|nr:uncharacterized protein MIND_00090900 [Mycena indigotica]KAF7315750.1 hypothetical protein MIND_00090900 [Mycena indigotica]
MSQPLPVVTYILGGWDLGVCGDLLLQGVIFAQISHYFSLYRSDGPALRMFVFGLLFLTTLKSMQMIAILWTQNVIYFTNIRAAATMFTSNWLEQINLGMSVFLLIDHYSTVLGFGGFITFCVQVFLCQRLWALSKNIYIVTILMAVFTFSLVAAFVAVGFTFNDKPVRGTWISVHLGVVFGGDLLLCGSTAYFLLKHSKQVLPQTAGMLNAILKLTVQSAVPGALCAMVNLITSQTGDKLNPFNVSTMLSIISTDLLPKLYAISAMWTLNSRRAIQLAGSAGHNTSSIEGQSDRRRTGAPSGVELGTFGKVQRIQVRTQVQTLHHTDDDDVVVFAHGNDLKPKEMEELSLDAESGSTKKGLH